MRVAVAAAVLVALIGCHKHVQIVDREMTFDGTGPTSIKADELIFRRGGKIRVLHGTTLTVDVDRLVGEGTDIVFDGTGDVITKAQTDPGPKCASCATDWLAPGMTEFNDAKYNCSTNYQPATDIGGKGLQGYKGGPGAHIVIRAKHRVQGGALRCEVGGGQGGPGGPGGIGRRLCTPSCVSGAVHICPSGPQGDVGDPGDKGTCEQHIPK